MHEVPEWVWRYHLYMMRGLTIWVDNKSNSQSTTIIFIWLDRSIVEAVSGGVGASVYIFPGGSSEGVGVSQSVQAWCMISAYFVVSYDGRLHQLTPSCIRCRCVPVSTFVRLPSWYLSQVGQQAAGYRRHISNADRWVSITTWWCLVF